MIVQVISFTILIVSILSGSYSLSVYMTSDDKKKDFMELAVFIMSIVAVYNLIK